MKKPLRLWTCFWGEKHLDLFEKALVRSLSWPLNRDALAGATWDIWTKESEFPVVAEVAKSVGINIELHAADQFIDGLHSKYLGDSGVMMLEMFKISMKRCIDSGAQMFLAPPDTIFGGDSVANILSAGEQPGTIVFVVHMRVLPSILNDLGTQVNRFGPESSVGNARLVTLAMRNAHKSWVEAEAGHDRINSFVGGIMWKRRPNGVYAVQHRLPTGYLYNWDQGDYDFFARQNPPGHWPPVFGEIDHLWPTACVYQHERARVLGGSDDGFCCEITDELANVPAFQPYDKNCPDNFWRNVYHNKVNRQFCVTFRGE